MSAPVLTTPRAILIAGSVIAVGVFLGLRFRDPGSPAATPSSPAVSPPTAPRPAASLQAPAEADDPTTLNVRATEAVKSALELQRPRLREKCGGGVEGGSVTVTLNMSFDAYGKQLVSGVIADRDAAPDAVTCLSNEIKPVEIPAPGAPVSVDVRLSLP